MFLGTEFGLYVSIDAGTTWTKWTNDFPTVSTMDMVIHPREHDLVIGTFGRSVYVLDDIRPLREIAGEGLSILDEEIHLFDPPQAVQASFKSSPGYYSPGDGYFSGQNRARGAMITYSVKEGEAEGTGSGSDFMRYGEYGRGSQSAMGANLKKVKIEIFDDSGEVIRTLTQVPKTGINRIYWGMDRKGYRSPGSSAPRQGASERGGGGIALPGTYKVKMTFNGKSDSTMLKVIADPRIPFSLETAAENQKIVKEIMIKMEKLAIGIDRLKESETTMAAINRQIPKKDSEAIKNLKKVTKEVQSSLKEITEKVLPKEGVQGIYRDPNLVTSKIRGVRGITYETDPLNTTQRWTIEQTEKLVEETMDMINTFFKEDWERYKKAVKEADISFFKEYEPLEL
jgi:hypothetical protein